MKSEQTHQQSHLLLYFRWRGYINRSSQCRHQRESIASATGDFGQSSWVWGKNFIQLVGQERGNVIGLS